MENLSADFSFIRSDIHVIAQVEQETGKQRIILRQIDSSKNEILREEIIDCIHSAVNDFDNDLENVLDEDFGLNYDSDLENGPISDEIYIRSSENESEIAISPADSFLALKSWVAAITEMGVDAFQIQAEIEDISGIGIPLSGRLLRFVALIDSQILFLYLERIQVECVFEGKRHNASLIANLKPILDALFYIPEDILAKDTQEIFDDPNNPIFPNMDEILQKIFEIDPPIELFSEDIDYFQLLSFPNATLLSDFPKGFFHSKDYVRKAIILNPKCIQFQEFTQFLSFRTEPDVSIRTIAAKHEGGFKFQEFGHFFSKLTEPSRIVREIAALNAKAPLHPEFQNLLSLNHESEISVFQNALLNLTTSNEDFLSLYHDIMQNESCSVKEIECLLDLQDIVANNNSNDNDLMYFLSFDETDEENQREFNFTIERNHVTKLILKNCGLNNLPDSINNMFWLKILDVSGNNLHLILPVLQEKLPNLKKVIQ